MRHTNACVSLLLHLLRMQNYFSSFYHYFNSQHTEACAEGERPGEGADGDAIDSLHHLHHDRHHRSGEGDVVHERLPTRQTPSRPVEAVEPRHDTALASP